MSYTTKILKNGCKQAVFTGANTVGLLNSQYNGSSISSDGTYLINISKYYNL